MKTYLERRWGGGGEDPSDEELSEALFELLKPDEEHPDCWLSDENGWTIAAHHSGRVVLENPESDEGPWHLPHADHAVVLTLWNHLKDGNLASIRTYPWLPGYR
jgi:hypothetical protein